VATTEFIGRQGALAKLGELLASPGAAISVCAPEGYGKTRLAAEFVDKHAPDFAGGAHIAVLTGATSLDQVLHRVGLALDIDGSARVLGDFAELIGEVMAARGDVLLVLDDADPQVPGLRPAVARWLRLAPGLRVLATGRDPVKTDGETRLRLGALRYPSKATRPVDELETYEAVQLFVARAKAAEKRFDLDETNARPVAEIVRALSGVPLAVELAAARVGSFSPAEILERLPSRVELWTQKPETERVDAETRARTARRMRHTNIRTQGAPDLLTEAEETPPQDTKSVPETVDWSWHLLQAWEQELLAQLSVLRGSFSVEAADRVVDLSKTEDAPPGVGRALLSLAAKSLLSVVEDEADDLRFTMPTSVRRFASQHLTPYERRRAQNRHTTYFLGRGRELSERVDTHGGIERRRQLELEAENLLAVVRDALASSPPTGLSMTRALEGLLALEPVLSTRGPFGIHLSLLDAALAPEEANAINPRLRARVLESRGRARRARGMLAESLEDLEAALALAEASDDRALEGRVRANIGTHYLFTDRLEDADVQYQVALVMLREEDERLLVGRALAFMGLLNRRLGLTQDAIQNFEEAIAALREVGDKRYEAITQTWLGSTRRELGELDDASELLERALAGHRLVGNRRFEGAVLTELARTRTDQRRREEASELVELAVKTLREVLDRRREAEARGVRAELCLLRGDFDEARAEFDRAFALADRSSDRRSAAIYSACVASLDAQRGDLDLAGAALQEAQRLHEDIDDDASQTALELFAQLVDDLVQANLRGGVRDTRRTVPTRAEPAAAPTFVRLAHRMAKALTYEL
jgi:predicted ATPase